VHEDGVGRKRTVDYFPGDFRGGDFDYYRVRHDAKPSTNYWRSFDNLYPVFPACHAGYKIDLTPQSCAGNDIPVEEVRYIPWRINQLL